MKLRGVAFVAFVQGIFLSGLVSAQGLDLQLGGFFYEASNIFRQIFDSMLGFAFPLLQFLLGDYSTNQFFITKVLLLILLFAIISSVMKNMPRLKDNTAVGNVVAVIVSILAVRFMDQNQLIEGILLPYGALGVALLTLLPFVIFFYWVYQNNFGPGARKLAWIFFGSVLFILWIYRFNDLASLSNWIYGITFAAVLTAIFLDKNIKGYFSHKDINDIKREHSLSRIAQLETELDKLYQNQSPSRAVQHRIESIERLLKELYRQS